MPTVPVLETPTVQQEPLPGRANPRLSDDVSAASFGSGIAQGLEAVGAAGSAQEAKFKDENDKVRVIDANTQLEAARTAMLYGKDGKGGAASLHGTDAMDMPNRILPQYDQVAGSISSSLTPDQQRLFKGHIAAGRGALDLELNRYEFEESNRLANEVYTNGVKQTVSNASVGWRDPAQIGKARQDLQALVQMQGDREGWSKDERAQQLAKMQAEMHFNVVDRQLADGKPQAALSYFKAVRDTGELTGEQAHQLGAQIDAALQQHTAQNQSEMLARLRDVSTAAINGLAISPANMPAHGAVLAAFPQDGERRWKAMQDDIAMGADLKGMSTMSPPDIQAKVDSYKPTSVAGAADQFERYNAVGVAAQRVLTSRNADPRQYTIDNKLGAKPLDFSDMQGLTTELRTRLASTPQTSAQMGGYVPPLSKPEAAQFAQRLETMPAADRLRTLASLNQGLADDKGFQTVMHQIMPGSPVTAIVGSQLGQTAPNNVPVWFDRRFAPKPEDQTRILAGEALLNPIGAEKSGEKGKPFPMPPEGTPQTPGMRYAFSSAAGDIFRNRPELADAYYAAFKGAYAQLASESGNMSGQIVPDLQSKALKMVLGGNPVDVNGKKVAVPFGLDPTRFQSVLDAAINVKAQAAGGLDTSKYTLGQNDPAANPANWDKRADGSVKGNGFLGLLKRPDGKVSSEISIGVEVNGKEVEVPTMVPTLSQSQLDYLMTNPVGDGHPIPRDIVQKATAFASQRIAAGKSPFAGSGEQLTAPADFADKMRGYHLEELGALGSGRYKLTQGNADLVNPDGKGLFIVDLRNQYMAATGAKPAEVDTARMAQEQPAAPPSTTQVGGDASVPKVSAGKGPTFKPPPVTGLARGGRGSGRTHPSQGAPDT